MRIESIFWAFLTFGLCITIAAIGWTDQVNVYDLGEEYNDTALATFEAINYENEVQTQANISKGEVTVDESLEYGFIGGIKKGVSTIWGSFGLMGNVTSTLVNVGGFDNRVNSFFWAFLIVSVTFGLIYIVRGIRSW